jgi:hypothetical protein
MSETDKELVKQDAERVRRGLAQINAELGNVMDVAGPGDDTSHHGDGERVLVSFHIGSRGELDWFAVQQYAKSWKTFRARHPKSPVVIFFLGYDMDPREIWDIPECVQYIRWFAKAVDINKPSDLPPDIDGNLFGIMARCGVFPDVTRAINLPFKKWGEA